jgi:hypothetical protein
MTTECETSVSDWVAQNLPDALVGVLVRTDRSAAKRDGISFLMLEASFGNRAYHRDRYARLMGF